jgi:UDP-2-acetamido-3-amino-2,3-dideoxy-glucuronate N-acetyltransferase
MGVRIHATAEVAQTARIGDGTSIWNDAQVRDRAQIGAQCIVGKNVYIDSDVVIGDAVKIQNNVSVFHGVVIESGVFIGPHVCFTNDMQPRAINRDGTPKRAEDWVVSPTLVKYGAAVGANSTIVCGVSIGRWAMIGSGSVVTRDVPDFALVYGSPARVRGYVCPCGANLTVVADGHGRCEKCGDVVEGISVNS